MKYQVLRNNKPADNDHFPNSSGEQWKTSIFDSFFEAKIYALMWAYPVSEKDAKEMAKYTGIIVNEPIDLGLCARENNWITIIEFGEKCE